MCSCMVWKKCGAALVRWFWSEMLAVALPAHPQKRNAVFQIDYWLALLVIAQLSRMARNKYVSQSLMGSPTRKQRTSTKNKNNNNEHKEEGLTTHPNNSNNLENKEHNQEQGKHNFEQHRTNTNTTILKTTEPKRRPG